MDDGSETEGFYQLNNILTVFEVLGEDAVDCLRKMIFGQPVQAGSDFVVSQRVLVCTTGFQVGRERNCSLTELQVWSMPDELKAVVSESLRLMNECVKDKYWTTYSINLYDDNPSLINVLNNDYFVKHVVFKFGDMNFDALLRFDKLGFKKKLHIFYF